MHSKQIGNLGELKVAAHLTSLGFYVFTELGDICKTDLIVMGEDYKPLKVQVKCETPKNGSVSLSANKAGPGYRFRYEPKHADVYALYVAGFDLCLFVASNEILAHKKSMGFRLTPARNNQESGVRPAENFLSFERALRALQPTVSEGR